MEGKRRILNFLSFAILALVAHCASSAALPDCSPGQPDHQPHPTDCSKYYTCSNGVAILQECPPGLWWSVQMDTCDLPANTVCDAEVSSTTAATTSGTTSGTTAATTSGTTSGTTAPSTSIPTEPTGTTSGTTSGTTVTTTGTLTSSIPTEPTGTVTSSIPTEPTGTVTSSIPTEPTGTVTSSIPTEPTGTMTSSIPTEPTGTVTSSIITETTITSTRPTTPPTTSTQTPTPPPGPVNQCPPVEDPAVVIRYPHETNCGYYYKCERGRPTIYSCSLADHFSPTKRVCVRKTVAGCDSCPPVDDPVEVIRLPHENNCRLYYLCVSGLKMLFQCQVEFHFSRTDRTCMSQTDAKCTLNKMWN